MACKLKRHRDQPFSAAKAGVVMSFFEGRVRQMKVAPDQPLLRLPDQVRDDDLGSPG